METTNRQITIFPVLMVNFIGVLGYSIIIPMLIFLVEKFGGNGFIYGILGAVYPTFQLFGAPLLGKLSDQIGRKSVLAISQVGTLLAWILFAIALVLPRTPIGQIDSIVFGQFFISLPLLLLFVARAFDGLTGGNISVANAYLSDISTEATRKSNFGKMASSSSLGFIVGPLLAGALGSTIYGELVPVLMASGISLAAIFVIIRFLPESKPDLVSPNLNTFNLRKILQTEHRECYEMEHCPEVNLRSLLKIPTLPRLYFIYFVTFLGFSFYYAGLPIYTSQYLSWNSTQLGLYLTLSSAIMIIVQGPGLSYLSGKVPDGLLVVIGSFLISLSFFLLPMGNDFWVYAANVCMAIGNGLMWPSFLAILASVGNADIQGTIQGYGNSMGSLASIFGLIIGGTLFSILGPTTFWIGTTFMVIVGLLSLTLRK